MASLVDRYGRRFPYLRLSLIEACNFRCSYCLPQGYRPRPGLAPPLALAEIRRLIDGFARLGMSKVRLTGGEPSLRRDLGEIIAAIAAVPGVAKVALTSNGVLLQRRIADWHAAGLTHLNVSVDALDRARFAAITGHDRLPVVLDGIDRALALGLAAVKLNAVLLRGLNDDQLPAFLDYLRTRDVGLRFIELMQTGDNRAYFRRHHYRAEALERELQAQGWSLQPRAADAGPARDYAHPDYAGRIGIIAPYSRDFCAGCNRLRVTAGGDLRLCLFGNVGIPLRPLLQADAQAGELQAALTRQLGLKSAGHGLHRGETGLTPHLASLGG
ncbi:GTP 3',8-cyclase MoaA [Tahibacter caeni]|uniref:GTP 3',8-cyclase MoaA n=1 Tax=Tahibacter caeni TaxID=1453545 RepID=UPI0021478350|nr:GTP 3',8-cyclase MoaA [Tahibacter caeni]